MLRELDFNEISDGKFYQSQDMVRADCGGCKGCSSCCRGMGSSIVLDPLDVHRIASDLGKSFDELLASHLDLQVVDGIILPNLKMTGLKARHLPDLSTGTVLRRDRIPVFFTGPRMSKAK